jgi:hypothetical protein
MLKRMLYVLLITCFAGAIHLTAQTKTEVPPNAWMDKVGIGGNVGLRFGDVTYIEVSPIAGYRAAPFIMPGIGVSYRYIQYRYPYRTNGLNILGASAWVRFYILPMVFGYAEHEELYGEFDPYYRTGEKYFIGTNFLGGGYSQEMGRNSTYVMVLFAMNQDYYNAIYANPVIRVGFMIGGSSE